MILLLKFVYEDARDVDYGTALCVRVRCGRGYSGHIINKPDQWSYKRSPDYCPGITTTMKNKKSCCKSFVKISAVAQQ